jgi:CHAD domain-containing protein
MSKVRIAQLITQRNFYRNAKSYADILQALQDILGQFADAGVLEEVVVTAPEYAELPEAADDQIVVPNAWSARYVNHLRKVTITGTLYIGS